MIREAKVSDIPRLLEMGAKFVEVSQRVSFDEESTRLTLEAMIENESSFILVADNGGVIGMLGVLVYPVYFNHNEITAQELFWWVDKKGGGIGSKLLEAGENKAREMGAKSMLMLSTTLKPESLRSYYESNGYSMTETTYIKVFKDGD